MELELITNWVRAQKNVSCFRNIFVLCTAILFYVYLRQTVYEPDKIWINTNVTTIYKPLDFASRISLIKHYVTEFCGFFGLNYPKISCKEAKPIHIIIFYKTSKGRYNLNSQRENKPRPLISISFLKTRGNTLKSFAEITFQVLIHFNPSHPLPMTPVNSKYFSCSERG